MSQAGTRYDETALQWFVENPSFINGYGWHYCEKSRLFYHRDKEYGPVKYDDELEHVKKNNGAK